MAKTKTTRKRGYSPDSEAEGSGGDEENEHMGSEAESHDDDDMAEEEDNPLEPAGSGGNDDEDEEEEPNAMMRKRQVDEYRRLLLANNPSLRTPEQQVVQPEPEEEEDNMTVLLEREAAEAEAAEAEAAKARAAVQKALAEVQAANERVALTKKAVTPKPAGVSGRPTVGNTPPVGAGKPRGSLSSGRSPERKEESDLDKKPAATRKKPPPVVDLCAGEPATENVAASLQPEVGGPLHNPTPFPATQVASFSTASSASRMIPLHEQRVTGDFAICIAPRSRCCVLTPDSIPGEMLIMSLGGAVGKWSVETLQYLQDIANEADTVGVNRWTRTNQKDVEYLSIDEEDTVSVKPGSESKKASARKQSEEFKAELILRCTEVHRIKVPLPRKRNTSEAHFRTSIVRSLDDRIGPKVADVLLQQVKKGKSAYDYFSVFAPIAPSGFMFQVWDGCGRFGHLCWIPRGSYVILPSYTVYGEGFMSNADAHARFHFVVNMRGPVGPFQRDYNCGRYYFDSEHLLVPSETTKCSFYYTLDAMARQQLVFPGYLRDEDEKIAVDRNLL